MPIVQDAVWVYHRYPVSETVVRRVHSRLLASMLDAERYPAAEITLLYYQRWELETGFAELHTHTLERLEALRSQTPVQMRQKLFALAVVYNLVRLEMAQGANQLEVSPL